MSRILAISWDSTALRYVFADARRERVRILNIGERLLTAVEVSEDADVRDSSTVPLVEQLKQLCSELKASRAQLVLCLGRGSVDSARFSVPPATESELPTLVANMAQRQLTGLGDDAKLDFVSFPPQDNGARHVSAMAIAGTDVKLVQQLVEVSGCANARALVVTHPLRLFAADRSESAEHPVLVVSQGPQALHFVVVQHDRPVLSRTLRLAPGVGSQDQAGFIAAEIQRTTVTIGDRLQPSNEISHVVVVGSSSETATLSTVLSARIDAEVSQVSAASLVTSDAAESEQGAWAPLVAAVCEAARSIRPAVDFLNPRRPEKQTGRRDQLILMASLLFLLVGGGWYYVHSLFAEVRGRIDAVQPDLENFQELVGSTAGMRRQALGLAKWDAARMSWLDELRDLTIRMPSSPELSVRQFAATPSGSGYTVTFQGTSRSPAAHRAMEVGIQDEYHTTRTPSFSESRNGEQTVWNFRTTLQIKRRKSKDYTAHRALLTENSSSETKQTSNAESGSKKRSPRKANVRVESSQRGDE